ASAYGIGGAVQGATALVLDWWKYRIERHDSTSAPLGGLEVSASEFTSKSHGMSVLQSLELPRGISISGSFTRVARRTFGGDQPAEWFPAANFSWHLPPLLDGRSTIRLRGAYAELPGATPSLATLSSLPVGPPGSSGDLAKMERVQTIELGADASFDRLGSASVT